MVYSRLVYLLVSQFFGTNSSFYKQSYYNWLVVWNIFIHFYFPYIIYGNVIIPTDSYFLEGWQKTTNQIIFHEFAITQLCVYDVWDWTPHLDPCPACPAAASAYSSGRKDRNAIHRQGGVEIYEVMVRSNELHS
jgi:hypothetical protein